MVLIGYIEKFGRSITVAEMIGAGTNMEWLATIGALSACLYVGGVIGSIAVAAGRCLSGGSSLADVISFATMHGINAPWLPNKLISHLGFYDKRVAGRELYRYSAIA